MSAIVRNIILLGASIIFLLVFWVTWEIWRASALLKEVNDPASSVERGFRSAELDFQRHKARFKKWNLDVPAVDPVDLEGKYKEYEPLTYWYCVLYGDSGFEKIALKISDHEYNEYYVIAYNRRLKTLIDKNESI